ncbi:MAG: HNH endonuclease [Thermosynechococcaceae cyanobacterium]
MSKTYVTAALRRLVCERAHYACEYCLTPEIAVLIPHQIDHVIAEKHGGQTNEENLALACTLCNKHKGSDLSSIDPSSGETVRLYRPRGDLWHVHFQFKEGKILPQTAIGRVTVRLLQINLPERVEERKVLSQANVLRNGL